MVELRDEEGSEELEFEFGTGNFEGRGDIFAVVEG